MENDVGALDELHVLGFHSLPVTVIANKAVLGFNPNEIMEALQGTIKVLPLDRSETILLIERALEAVERAVRQMPDEKLDWSIPQRKRPMREFTYHIFSHALSIIEEWGTNVPAESEVTINGYTSFRDIADYGKTIIEKYRAWASKQNLNTFRTPPLIESKAKSEVDQVDLAAGAIVHHLRQLYSILEDFGITPEHRVPDCEWPSEYVLTILW